MALALPLNKSNPDARLARKREAARMRQQRCRARKRQALIVKRRQPEPRAITMPLPQMDSRPEDSIDRTKPSPFREAPTTSSPGRDPIFKIVSFDSPRSPRNGESVFVTPERSCSQIINRVCSMESSLSSASSPDKPIEVVKIEPKETEDSLVKEEEAAVAAMLSLKSSDSPKVTPTASPQETTEESHPAPAKAPTRDAKYAYYGEWEHYHNPYIYGRYAHYPPVPYYAMPPRVSATNYRYPAYGKGFSRYRYE